MNVQEFFKQFPDDDSCLAHLMNVKYGMELTCPKCKKRGKFNKLKVQPIYSCSWCGHHIHPMAGTPFQDSHTPLQKWFYAMYLFTTSRHGVPAKELQRQLSVTYKTAWRMAHEIRKYMGKVDGDAPLMGEVEIDETYIGGQKRGIGSGNFRPSKAIVLGMVERGGDVMTKVVPNVQAKTLIPIIEKNVKQLSKISTDELRSYEKLGSKGYIHGSVNHSIKQWKNGPWCTNTIEGFWSQVKRSVKGTHGHVSKKHLSKYLGEFEFRYNMRSTPSQMMDVLLARF